MKQKKLVIFDWGGVIESHYPGEYNIETAVINLFQKLDSKLPKEEIFPLIWKSYIDISDIKVHTIQTIEEMMPWFEYIKQHSDLTCDFETFCKVYEEAYADIDFYQDVVDFIHSLKEKCYLGILSNLSYLDKERIDSQVDLENFDYVWLSFALGYEKPNPEIYKIVESNGTFPPSDILFIDDSKENIEVAKSRGWNTCLATGHELNKIKETVLEFIHSK
ncbi:MAG: HAD-IA family hydrolase [Firmicutes bacterium]|nr:HAD-IA family hydrolase [Bacillota bacterium]